MLLTEVGPRDGLQNEKKILPLDIKVEYIRKLLFSKCARIEVTSFVKAEKIPQMQDAEQLFEKVKKIATQILPEAYLYVLVPNEKGLQRALEIGARDFALVTATSETFNQKNLGQTFTQSEKECDLILKKIHASPHHRSVRAYISTSFGCPYEGKSSLKRLEFWVKFFLDRGVDEVVLGDTIGVAYPEQVKTIFKSLFDRFNQNKFGFHAHDTRGLAVANIWAAYELGVRSFDSSSAGLGGCPYAPGASGNVATEDLLSLFEKMGVSVGVDTKHFVESSAYVLKALEKSSLSKSYHFYRSLCEHQK
jgi:hydroxymethylglutaryl-CoA lyase